MDQKPNGTLEFFTRAIDRTYNIFPLEMVRKFTGDSCDEIDYFTISAMTWTHLQHAVVELIEKYDGEANLGATPEPKLTDWKETYEMLKSDTPITKVPCK